MSTQEQTPTGFPCRLISRHRLDRPHHGQLAPACLMLLGLSPLATASSQSDDDFIAPPAAPAQEETAPAAPAAAAPAEAAPAAAQVPTQTLERVRVTGSAIARTDAETAVPVTVLDADEIRQQGITSAEELVANISSNDTSQGPGLATGSAITGGASFANLRGIGADKTLVLLNGRRLANNSFDGSAVDINSIPFGAVQRVEVLRDGASALYGTDAIGGVINFITHDNLSGGEIDIGYDMPTRSGGGDSGDISATWGNGDLQEDGFNFFGSLSYRGEEALQATDREGIREVYDPERGVFAVSSFSYPANYYQGDEAGSPLAGTGCVGEGLVDTGGVTCSYDYGRYGQMLQETEKTSLYSQLSLALAEDHTANLSYLWSRSNSISVSAPSPSSAFPQLQPGTPFYPADPALDTSEPVTLRWRGVPAGPRETYNSVDAKRVMLDFDGSLGDTAYNTAIGWNRSDTELDYRRGYLDDNRLEQAFNSGEIDPFSTDPLSAAGQQALAEATVSGVVQEARNDVYFWSGQLSREVGDWFGAGSSALAIGGDYRHERLKLEANDEVAGRAASGGLSPDAGINADRDVKSLYSELNVPIVEGLELTGALRYDDYSDVGDTTNPKISFRYQPIRQLLFRGAYSEGFRAPSLYELYDPQFLTFSPGGLNDPVLCPGGTLAAGGVASRDCNTQFQRQFGGNEDLMPEEAKNWTLGVIYEPLQGLSAGLDFWWIELESQVGAPSTGYVLDNEPGNVVRQPDGSIDYVQTTNANLGATKTNGVDVSANYRLGTSTGLYSLGLTGTYVDRYDYQTIPGGEYQSAPGKYSGGVIFRWKHRLSLNWSNGPWAAGLVNHYQTGYEDYDPETNADVDALSTWDALGAYTFAAGPTVTLGMINVMDEEPPFSNQPQVGQAGYDARYASALGRTLYARFKYDF